MFLQAIGEEIDARKQDNDRPFKTNEDRERECQEQGYIKRKTDGTKLESLNNRLLA